MILRITAPALIVAVYVECYQFNAQARGWTPEGFGWGEGWGDEAAQRGGGGVD
jgi:hypothetical protein